MRRPLHPLLALALLSTVGSADDRIRPAIERAIPLLERASAGSADQRECFTCHNQGLPVLALQAARSRGFTIDTANFERQVDHTYAHLNRNRERYASGEGTGGKVDTAGYALWTLHAASRAPDETTTAVAEFLLAWNFDDTHWTCSSDRPPSEASNFTTTYLALRGLSVFGAEAHRDRIAARTLAAKEWLANTSPKDNEDRVFRLLALPLVDAPAADVVAAADELLQRQRDDGGWSQLDDHDSDAYATATALVALDRTASLSAGDTAYRRGVNYLLDTQLEDGSWHIVSRSKPFQAYYESGFPHGTDQFISISATAWATMALLNTIPVHERTEPPPPAHSDRNSAETVHPLD